jgi:integrase
LQNIARRSKYSAISYSSGLEHLNSFITKDPKYSKYNVETILEQLASEKIDRYRLINDYISYLQNDSINGHDLTALSIKSYVVAVRSFFAYYDVETTTSKFKNKVKMPVIYHEDEEAIDVNDVRDILQHCSNRRLKAYLLVLASGGMRAVEALAIRESDLDLSVSPAEVRIRKEYAKTKRERRIFISDEAAKFLQEWLDWKYRDRHAENKNVQNRVRNVNDLVFSSTGNQDPHSIYFKILLEFQKLLFVMDGLKSRKQDGVYKRRKVTFHSFRRFVKTTISNQTKNTDFSEWFLGHIKSSYYTNKPEELRRIYKEDCMKYLTFLDYPTVEATGKSFEAQLKQKDKEIEELKQQIRQVNETKDLEMQELKQRDSMTTDTIGSLTDMVMEMRQEIENLKKKEK